MSEQTWSEKVKELRNELGREPNLDELIKLAKTHTMTSDEVMAQRQSWVVAEMEFGSDLDEVNWRNNNV
jgi:hypothetical protein